jgi:hypothetical protein
VEQEPREVALRSETSRAPHTRARRSTARTWRCRTTGSPGSIDGSGALGGGASPLCRAPPRRTGTLVQVGTYVMPAASDAKLPRARGFAISLVSWRFSKRRQNHGSMPAGRRVPSIILPRGACRTARALTPHAGAGCSCGRRAERGQVMEVIRSHGIAQRTLTVQGSQMVCRARVPGTRAVCEQTTWASRHS